MNYVRGANFNLTSTCVAFGGFEAMHLGHSAVLNTLCETAQTAGLQSVLLCMEPVSGATKLSKLYTPAEKELLWRSSHLDVALSYPWDAQHSVLSARSFFEKVLLEELGARVVVTGEHCSFGSAKEGDLLLLRELCRQAGIELIVCPTVLQQGRTVTNQWVRNTVLQGDFELAACLLGRPFTLSGTVVHGKAKGRTVGMPTVNLKVEAEKLCPPNGVYATAVQLLGRRYRGLTNVGTRPSVDDRADVTIETYVLDFAQEVYGKQEVLEFYRYIRPVMKFDGLQQVKLQVQKDLELANKYLDEML